MGLRIGLLMGRFSVSGWAAGFSSCADGTVSGFSVVSSAGLASFLPDFYGGVPVSFSEWHKVSL